MKIELILVSVSLMLALSCKKEEPTTEPSACFTAQEEIQAGVSTSFSSACSENATQFLWDFGDGGSSSSANPDHTYAAGGSYTVTLIVMDANGNSDEVSKSVTVLGSASIEHYGNIDSDETWSEGIHLVTGDVYVNGATLTIEPGVTVTFSGHTGIYLGYFSGPPGATLLANGTAQKPITFTSSATNKSPGDWDYIGFYGGSSTASSMQYCIVEYGGGYSDNNGEVYLYDATLKLDHSTISHSPGVGICVGDGSSFGSFSENTVAGVGTFALTVYGNFAHTIGSGNDLGSTQGVFVNGDVLEQASATWLKLNAPYTLGSDLYIQSSSGSSLTLMPGVDLRIMPNTGIYIGYNSSTHGTLIAEGTESEHITITSFVPVASRAPGDWDFIGFYEGAGNSSSIDYCDISYGGGYGSGNGMIYLYNSRVSIKNSMISGSLYQGIVLEDQASFVDFTGNTLEDNGETPIEIYGNNVHTIGTGNNFPSSKSILVIGDVMEQTDATWNRQEVPYLIDGTLYIQSASGSKLTLEPGSVIQFTQGSSIYVAYNSGTSGTLVAEGTPENLITFTSGASEGSQVAGDWDGIWFYDGTRTGTLMNNCLISYGGGYSSNSGNLTISNSTAGVPVISNCEISHSAGWGIFVVSGATPTLTDNTFMDNALGDVNQ